MDKLREELGQAPKSTRTYTVNDAVAAWLAEGLPARSGRTKAVYKDGLAPLLARPCPGQAPRDQHDGDTAGDHETQRTEIMVAFVENVSPSDPSTCIATRYVPGRVVVGISQLT
jgi:hypothetical protein